MECLTKPNSNMKIEIKERKLTAGNRSLYLEYYETGFRKKENLHLYLIPEDSPKARKLNREAYDKARVIRAERLLNPPSFEKRTKQTKGKNEKAETLTWLDWCNEYIEWSKACDNCKKMLQHKEVVRKRITTYLEKIKQTKILLKNVDAKIITGLFDYMRNEYRNPRQIKTQDGKLADYTLLLFEETVKAIFNKAVREELIAFNPVHSLTKVERFHAPDKAREFLTPEELTRFLAVETATENERTVQWHLAYHL